MNTIFMNSGSKTFDPHRILLSFITNKVIHMLLYSILAFTIHGKIYKRHTKIINLKYQFGHEKKSSNHLMDHILYQIFKITLNIF